MSFLDWSKKYYATSAKQVAESKSDDLVVVRHSLQKWRGLLPSVLENFNLELKLQPFAPPALRTRQGELKLAISADSCSMCLRYVACGCCPLPAAVGMSCNEQDSVFEKLSIRPSAQNVQAMVDVLQATEAMLESDYNWQGHNHDGPSWIEKTRYIPPTEECNPS